MDDSYDCGLRENPHLHRSKKKKEKTCMNKLKLWFLLMGSRPRKRIQVIQQAREVPVTYTR